MSLIAGIFVLFWSALVGVIFISALVVAIKEIDTHALAMSFFASGLAALGCYVGLHLVGML